MEVVKASTDSDCSMKQAFIIESQARAVCFWDAPDQARIEAIFTNANFVPESIDEVIEYPSA